MVNVTRLIMRAAPLLNAPVAAIAANLPDAKTWWRNFVGEGGPVTLTLDDTERAGHAVAHRDADGRVNVRIRLTTRSTQSTW